MTQRIDYRCPQCGAPAGATANVSWNADAQKWEVEGVHDEFWCLGSTDTNEDGCGWDGHNVLEVALPDEPAFDVWGEDINFTREMWRHEVSNNDTNQGYWEWVKHEKGSDSV